MNKIIIVLMLCILVGCSNNHDNPLESQTEPSQPAGIEYELQYEPDTIILSWNPCDNAETYHIFRKLSDQSEEVRIGESKETHFEDHNVTRGLNYVYSIQGIGKGDTLGSGLIGAKSIPKLVIFPVPQCILKVNPQSIELDESNNWTVNVALTASKGCDSWQAIFDKTLLSVEPSEGNFDSSRSLVVKVSCRQIGTLDAGEYKSEIVFKTGEFQSKLNVNLTRIGYLEGRCTNIFTDDSISQAEVSTDIGKIYTDANGYFKIPYKKEGDYKWKINHQNFLSCQGTISTSKGSGKIGNIAMIPIPASVGEVRAGFGFDTPWAVTLSDDSSRAFIVNRDGGFISVIDTNTNSVIGSITVGQMPLGLVYANDRLFVANSWDNTISVINPNSYDVITTIPVSGKPAYITACKGKLYVTLQDNISGNQVAVIDISTRLVERRISVGKYPYGIAIDPSCKYLYVANYDGDSLSLIDLATNLETLIPVGPNPQGVAVSPDGRNVYTADAGRISRIDVNNRVVTKIFSQPNTRFGWIDVIQLPDNRGDLVYATDMKGSKVWIWHPDSGEFAAVNVGVYPFGIATNNGQKIYVCIAESSQVEWLENKIYNINGHLIRTLNLGYRQVGWYLSREQSAYWDGCNENGEKVSSGVYFYCLRAGKFSTQRKLVVIK